jgi:2-enoate reductase
MKFRKLFEPIAIGNRRIENRIVMAPIYLGGLANADGRLGQRCIEFYAERARGGAGLIITGSTRVENEVERIPVLPPPGRQSTVFYTELAEAVHHYGTKVFVQLTAGFGRVLGASLLEYVGTPVSSSVLPAFWRPSLKTRELSVDEIRSIVGAFGRAATMLADCGVDGIELQGHDGCLFEQFANSLWNRRRDNYGGNLKGRLRFAAEVLKVIKESAGKDFPVMYRFGLKDYMKGKWPGPWSGILPGEEAEEGGRNADEGVEMAGLLEKEGFDALHVGVGCRESPYWLHPPGYQEHGCAIDLTGPVKKAVRIPVIAVGRLDMAEIANIALSRGRADLVSLGRGLLADPYWPRKLRENRADEIRPCIGCHYCLKRVMNDAQPLGCSVNPSCANERANEVRQAGRARRVMVIGGGPAGMEAARVASLAGHTVTLYEKGASVGGRLIPESVPPFKKDIKRLRDWYENQLRITGVRVHCGVEVTPEYVKAQGPEAVIVATGSRMTVPDIPGGTARRMLTCIDLFLGKGSCGNRVVVAGGGLTGCEVALWLADQGRKVTIVDRLPEPANEAFYANENMLLDMLHRRDVRILRGMRVSEMMPEGVVVADDVFKSGFIRCDTLALALGREPERDLYERLRKEIPRIYAVGDMREPKTIQEAIGDGFQVGRTVCTEAV